MTGSASTASECRTSVSALLVIGSIRLLGALSCLSDIDLPIRQNNRANLRDSADYLDLNLVVTFGKRNLNLVSATPHRCVTLGLAPQYPRLSVISPQQILNQLSLLPVCNSVEVLHAERPFGIAKADKNIRINQTIRIGVRDANDCRRLGAWRRRNRGRPNDGLACQLKLNFRSPMLNLSPS